MGYVSKDWHKSDAHRNRVQVPKPVKISVAEGADEWDKRHGVEVTLITTWLNGLSEKEYRTIGLTKTEIEQTLPYFLRESDFTDLPLGDPKRVAIVESLSKLSDTELIQLVNDISTARVDTEPLSGLSVSNFATELGLPSILLLEQLQAAGIGKMQESDSITEQDKAQLLEYLRQANNADSIAKGEQNIKTNPAANNTDAEEQRLMVLALELGRKARAQMMLEARKGERKLVFDELRKLDMDIEIIEKELERMK